jgi:flagellar biosynthesis/type III secretory pathway protein FliH
MTIIKSTNVNRLMKDAVVLDLGDIERQAERLLDRARRDAERILADAVAEAQRQTEGASQIGHEQGMAKGLADGREQGRAEGRDEVIGALKPQLEEIIANWQAALEKWECERQEMLLAAREDVLRFAFALAEKITYRAIEADPAVVKDQLAEALLMLSRPTAVTIAVNPADRELIDSVLHDLMAACGNCRHADVRDEPAIERGGCIVRTNGGEIDATIRTQLDRIAEALLPAPEQAADSGG